MSQIQHIDDIILRHKKAIKGLRKHIDTLYTMRFLEEDGLLNALEHTYDEIDYHINILRALKLAKSHNTHIIKGKRVFRVRHKCHPKGCSKCEHKSCKD